jgi:hypothetical protein
MVLLPLLQCAVARSIATCVAVKKNRAIENITHVHQINAAVIIIIHKSHKTVKTTVSPLVLGVQY